MGTKSSIYQLLAPSFLAPPQPTNGYIFECCELTFLSLLINLADDDDDDNDND